MSACKIFTQFELISAVLCLLLYCDSVPSYNCQEIHVPIASIACLPTDHDCIVEQQKLKQQRLKQPAPEATVRGYESYLDVPLPLPGELIGENIMIDVDQFYGTARPGQYCDSDADCDSGLNCILFMPPETLDDTLSRIRRRTKRQNGSNKLPDHHVCGLITSGACSSSSSASQKLDCPPDSVVDNYEQNERCFAICKCPPLEDNKQCKNCSKHNDAESGQDYLSPGNCCRDCHTGDLDGSHKLDCNVSFAGGNRTMPNGSFWLSPTNHSSHQVTCKECRCQSGFQVCNNTLKTDCPIGQDCITKEQLDLLPDRSTCCPLCRSCLYEGKHHDHGSMWLSEYSACQDCSCNNSISVCHISSCKPLECADNEIEQSDGECCPKCVCNPGLSCLYGRAKDSNGVELCACDESGATGTTDDGQTGRERVPAKEIDKYSFTEKLLYCVFAAVVFVIAALVAFICYLHRDNNADKNISTPQDKASSEKLMEKRPNSDDHANE